MWAISAASCFCSLPGVVAVCYVCRCWLEEFPEQVGRANILRHVWLDGGNNRLTCCYLCSLTSDQSADSLKHVVEFVELLLTSPFFLFCFLLGSFFRTALRPTAIFLMCLTEMFNRLKKLRQLVECSQLAANSDCMSRLSSQSHSGHSVSVWSDIKCSGVRWGLWLLLRWSEYLTTDSHNWLTHSWMRTIQIKLLRQVTEVSIR